MRKYRKPYVPYRPICVPTDLQIKVLFSALITEMVLFSILIMAL